MVELALVMPLLVFGLLGGADLARAFAVQMAIQNGARAGAEAYAINKTPTAALAASAASAEIGRTPTVVPAGATVTVSEAQSDGITPCVHPPPVASPCFVTVEVQYTFKTTINWPWIPSVANFDRSTIYRMFY
jgi:Flp pilus assembly protein TadG